MKIPFVILIAGLLAYFALACLSARLWDKRRKSRWPFKPTDRLLRGPGESLKQRVQLLSEEITLGLVAGMATVAVVVLVVFGIAALVHDSVGHPVASALGMAVAASGISIWTVLRKVDERAKCRLGWFGERYTAERLESLKGERYRIIHDIPCAGATGAFNLDHVVVGPTGVFVIETKARRKPTSPKGDKNHEVTFDGVQLIWPRGFDRKSVEQAKAEAQWLRKFIRDSFGEDLDVLPIVSVPGWFVRETLAAGIRVINPNYVASVIKKGTANQLAPDLVARIASSLEQLTRDVDD